MFSLLRTGPLAFALNNPWNTVFEERYFYLAGAWVSVTDWGLLLDFWMTVHSWAGGLWGPEQAHRQRPPGLLGCKDEVWAGFLQRLAQEAALGWMIHISGNPPWWNAGVCGGEQKQKYPTGVKKCHFLSGQVRGCFQG